MLVSRRWMVLLSTLALAGCVLFASGAVSASPPDTLSLITLRPGASSSAAEQLIASMGGRIVEAIKPLSIYRVAWLSDQADAALAALRAHDDVVRAAEVEGEQQARVVPNDALYRTFQWNLRRIGMEQAWDLRPSAAEVLVAVLDTGVDLNHPDLKPNLVLDQGYDFLDDLPSPQDDESHGTAVAGIIGATGNNREGVTGIAWHVKLLPIKAL
ncbi:MAG TPA: S8 family serine peptidase, partial [Chloroflexota bacterium]|nr:S8 family serine peptidase [Chloroflexota bacterium]